MSRPKVSVSGYPASEHCGIKETVTTCKAISAGGTYECERQDLKYLCVADAEGGACYTGPLDQNTGIAEQSCVGTLATTITNVTVTMRKRCVSGLDLNRNSFHAT